MPRVRGHGHTGGCGTRGEARLSTTWYGYTMAGNAVYVVIPKTYPEPEEPKYSVTRLEYARNGVAVTFVLRILWVIYAPESDLHRAQEFLYSGPRQRYMDVQPDPNNLEGGVIDPISTVWSDYDGNEIYGDSATESPSMTQLRSLELRIGRFS